MGWLGRALLWMCPGKWKATINEPTFMGFTQSELCARHDAFLKAEIEKNRKFIASKGAAK